MGFETEHAGLEENLGSTEARERDLAQLLQKVPKLLPFVANSKDLSIREFVSWFRRKMNA
jgi:hypothetical protein